MLALVEGHFKAILSARNDDDILGILRRVSRQFGIRSAYIIEYVGPGKMNEHILDTNEERAREWQAYFDGPLHDSKRVTERLKTIGMVSISRSDFVSEEDQMFQFCSANDLLDSIIFPVHHAGEVVGVVGFSGPRTLDMSEQNALLLLSFSLFAQARSLRNTGVAKSPKQLTGREKEVMRLSADGLTSQEIAKRLGLSPRTVNQHVDNVAYKLGTKNCTHTVAEAIRNSLLD